MNDSKRINMNREIKKSVESYFEEWRIDQYGYGSCKPFDDVTGYYMQKNEEGQLCSFEYRDTIEELSNPLKFFAKGKTFISMALPYEPIAKRLCRSKEGRMSAGTIGIDYHMMTQKILEGLGVILERTYGIDSKIIVDTTPLSDRAIAVRTGIGIIRRNNMCYNRKYGSYFTIGSLIIDYKIQCEDQVGLKNPCGTCRRCVEHCPGEAILGNYSINSNRCVSYLTQKKVLEDEERQLLGQKIYGCDVCQQICPANRGVFRKVDEIRALEGFWYNQYLELENLNDSYPKQRLVSDVIDIEELMTMSNKDFKTTYKNTASGWRGKRTLQRNGITAMGNSGDATLITYLETFLIDDRPVIREEAEAAIKRLQRKH